MNGRQLFYVNVLLVAIALWLGMRLVSLESNRVAHVAALPVASPEAIPEPVQGVKAATYAQVAQRQLFSRDRNAMEVVPMKTAILLPLPPPPPPFPKVYGVMMVGDNPRVILGTGGEGQKIYRPGDLAGGWRIVKFDSKTITLKCMDNEVTKELAELADSTPVPVPVQVASKPPVPQLEAGAVVDGMKKVCVASPFGNKCYGEPVKK